MSSAVAPFSSTFAGFAALAKVLVTPTTDGALVADPGGEIRYSVRRFGQRWQLTRAERSQDATFEMESANLEDIERELTLLLGDNIRAERGYALLRIPLTAESLPEGSHIVSAGDKKVAVVTDHNEPRVIFRDTHPFQPCIEFFHVADVPLAALRESLLAPNGAPALRQYVTGE